MKKFTSIVKRKKYRLIAATALAAVLLFSALGAAFAPGGDFDTSVKEITGPYRFSILKWELNAIGEGVKKALFQQRNVPGSAEEVVNFFDNINQIKRMESEIASVKNEIGVDNLSESEVELDRLQAQSTALMPAVEGVLEAQIKEVLSGLGIYNPLFKVEVNFPPVNFKLEKAPYLLVVSPRDRIESIKEVTLLPEMDSETMESMENSVDKLGVSSLVVELGGFASYPSYIAECGDLRFIIETAVHEWLHEYLAFKPLGFLYLLDITGIRSDYDIATMNETVVGMVSKEIAATVYDENYGSEKPVVAVAEAPAGGFDFNREMREIRKTVDSYLAGGQIEQAEQFMEQKRQYLATRGYNIRKLNQAYFAFYGTYADGPASVSPIGAGLKRLRSQTDSLKDFLAKAASMTSYQDLIDSIR